MTEGLAQILRRLEEELHRPETRRDAARMRALLHPDFEEIGRSRRHYTREDIIRELPAPHVTGLSPFDALAFRVLRVLRGSFLVSIVSSRSSHRVWIPWCPSGSSYLRVMNPLLCSAIGHRRVVTFYYDGGRRTVEPYCHGASEAGHDLLSGYQTAGHSISGATQGCKTFRVDKVSGLAMTDEVFAATRPEYDPSRAEKMATIYCRIE